MTFCVCIKIRNLSGVGIGEPMSLDRGIYRHFVIVDGGEPMKIFAVVLSVALIAAPSVLVLAEPFAYNGSGGWGPNSVFSKAYDPRSVETIRGKVNSIDYVTPYNTTSRGVVMTVNTGQDLIPVHLGPAWFIASQDQTIDPGDRVEVTGSLITYQEKPVMIAGQVVKGDETLKLRAENGRPMWSAWSR